VNLDMLATNNIAVTTNPLQITFIGVLIAIAFMTSIVGVLGWMLRLPKETERTRTAHQAIRSVNRMTRILVPILAQSEATDRIVALAAQMIRQRNGSAVLLAVIEVPFTLPINAQVEEDEKYALELLERAEAVAQQCGTKNGNRISRRILKARNAGAAIVREAEEETVDMILIARTSIRGRGNVQQVNPAIDYVLKNAPCEVLVLSPGHHAPVNSGETREPERVVTTVS
jgi:nucleotide-binding universal stress UspA family protein